MPSTILKNMKTSWVDDDPWTSPDGKVTIWNIKLKDDKGEPQLYSTMSKAIAVEGWAGDVELYTNTKGKEYVRQAPKEDSLNMGSSAKWQPKDSKDITLGLVYKTVVGTVGVADGDADIEKLKKIVRLHAQMLFDLSDEFKLGKDTSERDEDREIKQTFNDGEPLPEMPDSFLSQDDV